MADIVFEFDVKAAPDKVYKAVSETTGYRGWWTTNSMIKPEVGSMAEFKLKDHGHDVVFQMEVSRLETNKAVELTIKQATPPDWPGTKISIALAPGEEGTHVIFSQTGFPSTGGSFGVTNFNWGFFMGSLKAYAESGHGMPYKYE